jgi:hypothetical protein
MKETDRGSVLDNKATILRQFSGRSDESSHQGEIPSFQRQLPGVFLVACNRSDHACSGSSIPTIDPSISIVTGTFFSVLHCIPTKVILYEI